MPNLRIIYDNAVDRATSITAAYSTDSSAFPVSNVQNDYKGKIHRGSTTNVDAFAVPHRLQTYTLTWNGDEPEVIGGIVLPATNLSSSSKVRVRLYSTTSTAQETTKVFDSGWVLAAPGGNLEDWDWNLPLNANAFAFGGYTKTAIWVSQVQNSQYAARALVLDIDDTYDNDRYPQTIDCSRIIAGAFWEPSFNAKKDTLNLTIMDTSTTSRNNSGDLLSDRGVVHDHLTFDFQLLGNVDKENLTKLLRNVGTRKNIVVSIFPEENSVREQDYIIYGKRSNSAVGQIFNKFYSHTVEITGW